MMIEIEASAVSDFLSRHEVDEPIVINRQNAPHAVMIPYELFQVMHAENRQVLGVDELTNGDLEAIHNSKPPAGHA